MRIGSAEAYVLGPAKSRVQCEAVDVDAEVGTRPYFDVDDINAGIARVKELGGQADDAMPVPEMGWFATCTDPHGNEFGLWQTDPNAPAPGQ